MQRASDVRKCSVSQVRVSADVSGLPARCAAEEANFSTEGAASLGRVGPESGRPGMSKAVWPNDSHSGMSTMA